MSLVQLRTRAAQAVTQGFAGSDRMLVDPQARQIRYLRVSVLDRCNYRCTYCMPDRELRYGPKQDVLSLEEIVRLCSAFARWGIERVRLTGGEPTLRRGVVGLVRDLRALDTGRRPLDVAMTTNGELLDAMADDLARAGLGSITVSLDSLDADRFRQITRRGNLSSVLAGIEAAGHAGLRPVKINTVAIRGFNDHELGDIAAWAWDHDCVPRFIELMPMAGGELFAPGELMSAADVRDAVADELGARIAADGGDGVRGSGPATYWRVESGRHAGRRLGTIAAMTENFCGDCNRLRVSATGQLHACLARDERGDLRAALRSGDEDALERTVRSIVGDKRDGHEFQLDGTGGPSKTMVSIGG